LIDTASAGPIVAALADPLQRSLVAARHTRVLLLVLDPLAASPRTSFRARPARSAAGAGGCGARPARVAGPASVLDALARLVANEGPDKRVRDPPLLRGGAGSAAREAARNGPLPRQRIIIVSDHHITFFKLMSGLSPPPK
jgi:hypothetical protein